MESVLVIYLFNLLEKDYIYLERADKSERAIMHFHPIFLHCLWLKFFAQFVTNAALCLWFKWIIAKLLERYLVERKIIFSVSIYLSRFLCKSLRVNCSFFLVILVYSWSSETTWVYNSRKARKWCVERIFRNKIKLLQ